MSTRWMKLEHRKGPETTKPIVYAPLSSLPSCNNGLTRLVLPICNTKSKRFVCELVYNQQHFHAVAQLWLCGNQEVDLSVPHNSQSMVGLWSSKWCAPMEATLHWSHGNGRINAVMTVHKFPSEKDPPGSDPPHELKAFSFCSCNCSVRELSDVTGRILVL